MSVGNGTGPAMFEWWVNKFSYFRLTWELDINVSNDENKTSETEIKYKKI